MVKAVAKMQTGTSFRMQYETRWCTVSQKKNDTYLCNKQFLMVKAVAKMQTGTSFRMQYETRWCAVSQKKTTLTYVTNWWYRPTSVKNSPTSATNTVN